MKGVSPTQPGPGETRADAYYGNGRLVGVPGRRPKIERDNEDVITLNLVDLPLQRAAKTVLGDIMGARYSIDPKVDGRITIQTSSPVPRADIVAMFETALKGNGSALVESGGGYRILPVDQASAVAPLKVGANVSSAPAGTSTQVVPLRYVTASEIKRILEPMSPRGSILRADDSRNAIILSGTPQELSGMMEAITVFDVDVMKGMSFAIVPVKSSDPDAIADDLRTVFSSGKESGTSGIVKFLPNKRLRAVLVISSQPAYLARAETWIRRLDAQARGSEKQLFTFNVQNRPAKELVAIVRGMYSKELSASEPVNNVAPVYQPASISSGAGPQQSGPFGGLGGMNAFGATGAPVAPQVAAADAGQGSAIAPPDKTGQLGSETRLKIVADDSNNTLLIMATPEDYRRLQNVLTSLDVMPNQVLIEATIAEVSLNDELKFGVQWYLQKKQSSGTFADVATGSLTKAFPGFSYLLTAANTQVTLDALNAITKVNVISSPSLMVLDNKTATLQVGDQVPIATQSAVSTLQTGATVNSINYKDTGVILSVTPRVNESGRVLLDIEQEVSSVSQTTTSAIDSPTIQQRRVKTTVIVNDSEAVTLGGLIQNKTATVNSQVPIIGDIPVLGNAFRQKDDTISKTELIIMITPHVVRDQNEARRVTDEYRRKLDRFAPHGGSVPHLAQTMHRALD